MKFFIATVLLASSFAASAASKREIFDLQYLPNAGTLFGFSEARVIDGRDARQDSKTNFEGYNFNQTVGYSVMDSWYLAASMNWGRTDVTAPGATATLEGISDPTISTRFRVMDDTTRFDIIASYLVSTGDRELDSGNDFNNKVGGAVGNVGAELGQKMDSFQWAARAVFTRNFEATTDFGSGIGKLDLDAHNAYTVGGDVLAKLSEMSLFKTSLTAMFIDEHEDENKTSYASSTNVTLGGEYQYLVSQNLMIRAGLSYGLIISDKKHKSDQTDLWTGLLAANYQF